MRRFVGADERARQREHERLVVFHRGLPKRRALVTIMI
jgi:hypothetical protein